MRNGYGLALHCCGVRRCVWGAWPVVGHVFLIADAGGLQVAKRAVLRAVSDVSSHPTTDGGVLWALREVDQGRTARPGDLLQGLYDGRVPQLLMALLPQLLALVVTFLVIHYSSLQGFSKFLGDLMTMHQPGAQYQSGGNLSIIC